MSAPVSLPVLSLLFVPPAGTSPGARGSRAVNCAPCFAVIPTEAEGSWLDLNIGTVTANIALFRQAEQPLMFTLRYEGLALMLPKERFR